jgi:hypothetical protein
MCAVVHQMGFFSLFCPSRYRQLSLHRQTVFPHPTSAAPRPAEREWQLLYRYW